MNTHKLLVSILTLVNVLLSACVPVATAAPLPVILIPDTAVPAVATPEPVTSDPNALAIVTGNYTYNVVSKTFDFILNSDGSYSSLVSSGKFMVTADQITFMENGSECASQPGIYKWSLENNILHLTPSTDNCQHRVNVFGSQEFEKEPAAIILPPSDPKSLVLIAGNYTYKAGGIFYQFNLYSNESFINLSSSDGYISGSGAISVVADQITFVGYDAYCETQPGVYHWSLENDVLHLTLVKDDCKRRADIFGAKTFEKVSDTNTSATVIWEIPARVNGIAADSQGNVYIVDGREIFSKYDTNGKLLGSWSRGLSYTTGIAVDDQGNVYVANFEPPEIRKFTSEGKPLLTWAIADGIGPVGLAFDSQGNLYVALHRLHDHYVEKYDPQGKLLGTWAKPSTAGGQIKAGPRAGPEDIAVDANGNTYIDDPKQLHKYDKDGKFLYSISKRCSFTVDSQDNLYLLVPDDNAILKFDSNGTQIGKWLVPIPGVQPGSFYGIAIDQDGNIFLNSNTVFAKIKLPEQ